MNKLNFKLGLFLGGLILLNIIVMILNLVIIASGNADFMNIFNGCIHVFCSFQLAMLCSEVLDQDQH